MKKLNRKQELFCEEFVISGNQAEAYLKAGYAVKNNKTAGRCASRLMDKEEIIAYIKELNEQIDSEKIADSKEIQERLTAILRMETREEQVVTEGCGEGYSEAKIVERAPQLKDVIKAGETLAKMQGAFDNSVNLNIAVPVFGGADDLED